MRRNWIQAQTRLKESKILTNIEINVKICVLFLINGHEAELNCVTVPQKIIDFDKHKKNICDFVKSMLFLIKKTEREIFTPVWIKLIKLIK